MNLSLDTRIHKHSHSSIMPHIKIIIINLVFRLLHSKLFWARNIRGFLLAVTSVKVVSLLMKIRTISHSYDNQK